MPLVRSQLTKATVAAAYVPSSMIDVCDYCRVVVWVVCRKVGAEKEANTLAILVCLACEVEADAGLLGPTALPFPQ